jgi:signal transduction histidine kinase/CheY-like chemotaxis protein
MRNLSWRAGVSARFRKRGAEQQDVRDGNSADPAHTIAQAVRGLRFRYVAVIGAVAVLGVLFVVGSHRENTRFSNATSMAALVAKATETTERVSRAALEMYGVAAEGANWTGQALDVHAMALQEVIEKIKALSARLDADLKSRLLVTTPFGTGEVVPVLEQFQAEVAEAVAKGAPDRVAMGKRLDGTISFLVQPALAQQAEALRAFNRVTADRVKLAVNIVGIVLAVFTAALLLFIFWPMERSIRAALAKLKTAVEGAKAADRAKSEFLANMSHEIRTPMNGVLGMAELMAHTQLDARQKTFNDVIVKSGNALLTIINDILDFSKIDAGHTELDPAPFNLQEAVEDVATLVSSRVAEKELELIVRVDPNLPGWIVGDVGRIRQVLTNLAGNAVKFTERGHVLIEVSREGGDILFWVTDTGIGIPEDKLASVFEKFSQVDASSTRRHEGTGLGLAIASKLAELMGGSIGAESRLGEGSTFCFRFPLVPHEGIGQPADVTTDFRGARVLIVDDNAINRDILTELARKWRFDACAVESGPVALGFLDHAVRMGARVDLMILDYHMPDMNGAQLLAAIRARPAVASLPVVLLTSVDHAVAVRELRSAGANAILTKPTRSSLLLTTITDELRKARPGSPARAEVSASSSAAGQQRRSAPATASVETMVPAEPKTELAGNLDILVAEDNEVNQLVFSQIIEPLGYSLAIAGDGRRAVEVWRRRRPALILMDVSMPEMNGFEATQRIREIERMEGRAHTPIMGVTAHALKGDRERCLEAGMDDYMTKPISPDRLETKLREWFSRHSAKRA